MSDELPQGWDDVLLTDVAAREKFAIVDGPFGSDLKLSDYVPDGTVPVLTTKNLTGTYDPNSVRFISQEKFQQVKRSKVVSGDILIAKIGSIGKCSIYPEGAPTAIIPANLCKITVDDQVVFNRYLYWQIRTDEFQNMLKDITSATAQPAFSVQRLKTLSIKLAPLPEQQRIVAKLELLLGQVDACRQRLAKIPALLKRFRQSVLAAACSGKLTEDWRVQNPHKQIENDHAPDGATAVPISWEWKHLAEISEVKGGVTKGRKFNGKKTIQLPYLRVANVQDGYLDLQEVKLIEALPEDKEKYALKAGDILFTEGGDRDKLGRGTVWRGEVANCIHQNHIFRARLITNQVIPDFISLATKSEFSRRYYFENASQTVNLASINLTMLAALPIPMPPLPEQQEIVRRVEALLALADNIEQRYKKAQAFVDKLTPSLLAKAFRGELVPQDPNDEPASALLERIKAEGGKNKPQSRKKR